MAQSETDRVYDELLVTLARSGDRRAGERLARRWLPRLLRTARYLLRDDELAQDAVQEAWGGICRGWSRLSDPAAFGPWAFGVLRRKCVDRIRANQRRRLREAPEEADCGVVAERGETAVALDQAFAQLSDSHREVAVLYFIEGLTAGEVATTIGVPVGTAKSRIFHARKSLQKLLRGEE